MVSTDHFRQEIRSQLELATVRGSQNLTIDSGELYKSVSKLPVFNPWMVFCCNAMRAEMTTVDSLIFDDAKETLLTVNYRLPRNQNRPLPKSTRPLEVKAVQDRAGSLGLKIIQVDGVSHSSRKLRYA